MGIAATVHWNSIAPRMKLTASPGRTPCEGFTRSPLRCTRPPLTAAAARERDLNSRTANSQRSIRVGPGVSSVRVSPILHEYNSSMNRALIERLRADLAGLKEQGLYKGERVLAGPQGGVVRTEDQDVVNLCANNYLGLANHPAMREAAHRALDRFGYGMASVRFICGTQSVHKQLEERLSRFVGTEDTIL